eukprot:scaffold9927_cov118-Isochrysis_galbana.AAC.5
MLEHAYNVRHELNLELRVSRARRAFRGPSAGSAEHAAELLVPMFPECARSALTGASEAQAWLPLAQQDALLSQAIRSKSGANGDRLYEAIKTIDSLHFGFRRGHGVGAQQHVAHAS